MSSLGGERHGENPEFQRDVIDTVRHSVSRMKGQLEQISQARHIAPQLRELCIRAGQRREACGAFARIGNGRAARQGKHVSSER